ncbi:hypothetical protein SEMRO_1054_G235920.1 [Seminavis robusta]|uniref:Uncharacterized protein n=1 Tax=Seminavis robusta TaxID=568900 RepID=A0A9N8EIP9_9STRA|nr:hypothetical protein SEMRO_1054_G235920.1 [Seminavis robusta]|eukprot:Sro1054_g235920.1 n/a (185) ;mRNA; f:6497-7209
MTLHDNIFGTAHAATTRAGDHCAHDKSRPNDKHGDTVLIPPSASRKPTILVLTEQNPVLEKKPHHIAADNNNPFGLIITNTRGKPDNLPRNSACYNNSARSTHDDNHSSRSAQLALAINVSVKNNVSIIFADDTVKELSNRKPTVSFTTCVTDATPSTYAYMSPLVAYDKQPPTSTFLVSNNNN